MKKPLHDFEFFHKTRTDTKYYTNILHGKKNAKGRLILINCADYLKIQNIKGEVRNEGFRNGIPKGEHWNIPCYDINLDKLRGIGRMIVLRHNKVKYAPTLIVGRDDKHIDDFLKKIDFKPIRRKHGKGKG